MPLKVSTQVKHGILEDTRDTNKECQKSARTADDFEHTKQGAHLMPQDLTEERQHSTSTVHDSEHGKHENHNKHQTLREKGRQSRRTSEAE